MSMSTQEQNASSRLFHLFGVAPLSLPRILAILASALVANLVVSAIDIAIRFREVLSYGPGRFLGSAAQGALLSAAILVAAMFLFAVIEESLGRTKALLSAALVAALAHATFALLSHAGISRIPLILVGAALHFLMLALVFMALSVPRKAFSTFFVALLAAQAVGIIVRWTAGLALPGPALSTTDIVVGALSAIAYALIFAGLGTATYVPPTLDAPKPTAPENAPSTGSGTGILPMPQGAAKAVQWTQGVVWEKEKSTSTSKVVGIFTLAVLSAAPLTWATIEYDLPALFLVWVAVMLVAFVYLMMSVGPMNMVGNRQLAEYLVPMLETDERILGICVAKRLGMVLWMTGVSKQVFLVFTSHRILLISTKLGASLFKGPSATVRDGGIDKVVQDIHICDWADRGTRLGGMMFPPVMHLSALKLRCAPMGQNEASSWAMFIRNTKLRGTLETVFRRCDAM